MSALTINPTRLSAPMGAMLAFLGVKGCMPLIHGAQGCASFSKVFFTRHFHDPIPVQTTAVSDITAIMDGGDRIVAESIENILKKIAPDLIGLISIGLTETKADILLAGGRSLYTALKNNVAFADVNQEKKVSYGGYDGLIAFANDVLAALENPVFKIANSKAPWDKTA